jgi:hypothetical protein
MADDDPRSVAERLRDFVETAEGKATSTGFQTQVHSGPAASPTNPRKTTQQVYEDCLRSLDPAERAELDRIIEKMRRALGSPPGAVVPP